MLFVGKLVRHARNFYHKHPGDVLAKVCNGSIVLKKAAVATQRDQ
jgi:hypothetical protein